MKRLAVLLSLLVGLSLVIGCGNSVSDKYDSDRADQKASADDKIEKESSGE